MESEFGHVDDWGLGEILGVFGLCWLRQEAPKFIHVHGRGEFSVEVSSEDSDSLLSEVAWVILEDVCSLMGQTSGLSSTCWMLPVLSDTTVSV